MKFRIEFDADDYHIYNYGDLVKKVDDSFFSDDNGYGEEDREKLSILNVGHTIRLDCGCQSVTRTE